MACDGEAWREHLAPSADAPSELGSPEMPLDTSTRDTPILPHSDASFKSLPTKTVMTPGFWFAAIVFRGSDRRLLLSMVY